MEGEPVELSVYRKERRIVRRSAVPSRTAEASFLRMADIGDCLDCDIQLTERYIASLDPYRDRKEMLRAREAMQHLRLAQQILYSGE